MTLSAVPDEHGRMAGYLCTAEDVTERENTQAALVRALEHQEEVVSQLRRLSRIKSDFVATVSHELRTPITGIVGYTELLEDGAVGELSVGQRDMIGRVDHNSRRLLLLIEDLLTLSHIESATLTLQPMPFDLRDAVTNAHATVVDGVASRPLGVVVSVPDEPVDYHGDPDQLERMVLNLLTNAVKFTPDGGHVHVELTGGEEAAELVVRDDGLGIPEAEQEQLFTRFFRSSTATERAIQGTGLGLSIVQAVVTLHGGTVALSSAVGTVATVRLPWLGVASGATAECTALVERVDPVEPLEQRSG